jgi:disulfide bond formation protein DsbB
MSLADFVSATPVNYFLSSLTVLAQVISLVLIITILFSKKENKVIQMVRKYGMKVAFIVVLTAMLGSLTYSDILNYEPCKLCWLQRILMYPQVLLLGIALWTKDSAAKLYALVLSLIGIPLAFYHYLVQLGVVAAPCSTGGYTVSCAQYFSMNFGYITIPMMAMSAFLLVALIMLILRSKVIDPKA